MGLFVGRRSIVVGLITVFALGSIGFTIWGFTTGRFSINASEEQNEQKIHAPEKPEYVEGEFIVKLKPDSGVSAQSVTDLEIEVQSVEKAFKNVALPGSVGAQSIDSNLSRYLKVKVNLNKIKSDKGKEPVSEIKAQSAQKELSQKQQIQIEETKDKIHQRILEELASNPKVEAVGLNYVRKTSWDPNDKYYKGGYEFGTGYDVMWGLKNLAMSTAWDKSKGDGVTVAVVDTGVDYNHEDLAANIAKDSSGNIIGYNFTTSDPRDFMDRYGHGTHVAGTIAAVGNNGKGVVGVAPKAKIMPVKGLDDFGSGNDVDLANAIRFAADNGAKVINMSWGGFGSSFIEEDALKYAYEKGVVLIAAAGNNSSDANGFTPANSKYVITVGALAPNNWRASFSNFGPKVDVMAPGVDIISTIPKDSELARGYPDKVVGEQYARLEGTSMAAPHVAGLAALEIAKKSEWGVEDIRNVIDQKARDLGNTGVDDIYGYGSIDPVATLSAQNKISTPTATLDNIPSIIKSDIDIKGTATGAKLREYSVEYRKVDRLNAYDPYENSYKVLATGNTEVISGVLSRLSLAETGLKDGFYYFRLKSISTGGSAKVSFRASMIAKNEIKGFPLEIPYIQPMIEPIVTKLDTNSNYADSQIIATTMGKLNTYTKDGILIWSKDVGSDRLIATKPTVADINGDRKKEIIIPLLTYADYDKQYNKLLVLNSEGTTLWEYNYDNQAGGHYSNPKVVVSDLDNDGQQDIITTEAKKSFCAGCDDLYTYHYRIIKLNSDGKIVQKKQIITEQSGWYIESEIAVADLKLDGFIGKKEIILALNKNYWKEGDYRGYSQNFIKIFEPNLGQISSKDISNSLGAITQIEVVKDPMVNNNKPLILSNSSSNPWEAPNTISLIDGKGNLINKVYEGSFDATVFPVKELQSSNLQLVSSRIVNFPFSTLYFTGIRGGNLPGWPLKRQAYAFNKLAADLNNDGKIEVIAQDYYGAKVIKDGKIIRDLRADAISKVGGILTGLSQEGKLTYAIQGNDLGWGYFSYPTIPALFAWEFNTPYKPNEIYWPMAKHDLENTNDATK